MEPNFLIAPAPGTKKAYSLWIAIPIYCLLVAPLRPWKLLTSANWFSNLLANKDYPTLGQEGVGVLIALFLFYFFFVRRAPTIREQFALRPVSWKVFLAALAATILLNLAFNFVGELLGYKQTFTWERNAFNLPLEKRLFIWIQLIILVPLHEEALFRGALFHGFLSSRLGKSLVIFLTAFLWTLIHPLDDGIALGAVFCIGIVAGVFRYKTNSLYPTLFIHVINNWYTVILIEYMMGQPGQN